MGSCRFSLPPLGERQTSSVATVRRRWLPCADAAVAIADTSGDAHVLASDGFGKASVRVHHKWNIPVRGKLAQRLCCASHRLGADGTDDGCDGWICQSASLRRGLRRQEDWNRPGQGEARRDRESNTLPARLAWPTDAS